MIAILIAPRQATAAIWLLDYAKWRCSALRLTDNIFNRWWIHPPIAYNHETEDSSRVEMSATFAGDLAL